jgi:hypothetical protein
MEGDLTQCAYKETGQTGNVDMHCEFSTVEDGERTCNQRSDLKVGSKFVARGRCEQDIFFEAPCKGISVVPVFARIAKNFMANELLNADAIKERQTAREFIRVEPLLNDSQRVLLWFQAQSPLLDANLQPGDVLLEKNFDENSPVVKGQTFIENKFVYGTKFTNHAMFVLQGGVDPQIAHSTRHGPNGRTGLLSEPLAAIRQREPNNGALFRVVVYRPVDPRLQLLPWLP